MKRLSRREMLRLSAMGAVGVALAACGTGTPEVVEKEATKEVEKVKEKVVTATPVPTPEGAREAPMLQELVNAGKLPPLADRLPTEPQVIQPLKTIGKYGGTIRRYFMDLDTMYMFMYGHSAIQYTEGGLGMRDGLAKSWESNADATEWTVYFREGTKWSDGEPFTVDDIIFWWEDIALNQDHPEMAPKWAKAGGELMEVERVDDYTIKFKFSAPNPMLDAGLAMDTNSREGRRYMAPRHYLEQFHPKYSTYADFTTFREKEFWFQNADCPVLTAWLPVEYVAGERLIMERNPYFYGVDTDGNQLPYIDRVENYYVENAEMIKTRIISGDVDFICQGSNLSLSDISMLKADEEVGGYRTLLWDGGSGTGALYLCNQNHPDPEKKQVYQDKRFRRALSHAIDRPKIQKTVYFDTGEITTGTFSSKAIEYNRTEEGKELYRAWRDSAKDYDPEKAKELLDEVGIVDKNGDGWRELPSGAELKLRIDQSATASEEYVSCNIIVKENWEAVGLQTIINPVPGEQLTALVQGATFDIRDSWELGNGPNHLERPEWFVPSDNERWAPLYGNWYLVIGTPKENAELDKDPRDRNPPREKPPEGSPYDRLQKLLLQAVSETDADKRDQLVFEMIRIHIDEGPFIIGTVGNTPRIIIARKTLGNVPAREDLPSGGFVNPWTMNYPAITNPEQYFYE